MDFITLSIKYYYGDAEQNRLDMYDATVSFQGFAKALSITAHALLNDGEVRKIGNRLEGGELYINPSEKGSFEQVVTFVITNKEAIALSITAAVFYDLIKWTWSKTLNLFYEPKTSHVKELAERKETFITEMEETLETPLEQAHRLIKNNPEMVTTLEIQRSEEVIRLDSGTLNSLTQRTESFLTRNIKGNVTRYNMLTGNGRFYDELLGKTVSFKIEVDVDYAQKQLLTWSLHFAQETEGEGKILIDAKRVITGKNVVKQYLVSNIHKY